MGSAGPKIILRISSLLFHYSLICWSHCIWYNLWHLLFLKIYRPHFSKLHLPLLEEKVSCNQIALLLWPTSLVFSDYKLFLLWFKSISSSVFPKSLFPGCRLSQTAHCHPLQTETLSNAAYGLPNVKFISWSKYLCVFIWDEIWCCFEYCESKQSSSHTAVKYLS